MSKTKIPVRFPNESSSYCEIEIDPSKLREVQIFDKEVFATIDEIRIAMSRDDYNKLFKNEE